MTALRPVSSLRPAATLCGAAGVYGFYGYWFSTPMAELQRMR